MAKRISCWGVAVDACLHQLVCYLHKTADSTQAGWIGDNPADFIAQLFCDADFAGCPYTLAPQQYIST